MEDALFCHRCGRPVRELTPAVEEEQPEAAPEAGPLAGPETAAPVREAPAFQNQAAIRVGFLAAVLVQLASILSAMAGASILLPLLLLGGGFYAAVLYMRRTGAPLTVIEGARVGWITGIFTFVIATVFFTAGMAVLSASGDLAKAYEESLSRMNLPEESVERFRQMLEDPRMFAFTLIAGLVFQFLFLTIFCSLGGALGARLRGSRQ
ncbi:MAG: hypothetical protein WHT08_06940 [Bryobacteraceae bacterium]